MAKVVKRQKLRSVKSKQSDISPFNIYWEKENYILLAVGILFIIAGFYMMSIGNWESKASLVFSPILLTIGYVFVIPAAIFYRKKQTNEEDKKLASSQSEG